MGWTRRTLAVGCLLTLVLAAPFAATASADSGAAFSGVDDWTADGTGTPDVPVADADGDGTDDPTATGGTVPDGVDDGNWTRRSNAVVDGRAGSRADALLDPAPNATGATIPPADVPDGPGSAGQSALPVTGSTALPVTGSTVVLELRAVSAGQPPTVVLRIRNDGAGRATTGVSGGTTGPAASPARTRGDDGTDAGAARAAGHSAGEDATTGSGDGSDTDGDAVAVGGLPTLDPDAVFGFASPLGTVAFVVASRPWAGLLSGAAALVSDWTGRAFVLLRSRRHGHAEALEHETRGRIHDLVAERPGLSLTDLSEALETPLSTVRHHVKVLERERVVVSRKLRGGRRLYPLDAENEELAAALAGESSAAIIHALHEEGRTTVGDVVDRVERSYGTVSYHLSRLSEDGLVRQERDGRETVSWLAPSVESLLEAGDGRTRASGEGTGREASAD